MQISEAKLNSNTSEVGSEAGGSCMVPHTPTMGHRPHSHCKTVDGLSALSIPPSPSSGALWRAFFQHVASSEGLHSRYDVTVLSMNSLVYLSKVAVAVSIIIIRALFGAIFKDFVDTW